jgi:hypothetical protein
MNYEIRFIANTISGHVIVIYWSAPTILRNIKSSDMLSPPNFDRIGDVAISVEIDFAPSLLARSRIE